MSLAQQLLLRALIARFWREPYDDALTRWGTELHDRFMLPYFVALDFDDVLEELRRAGYAIDPLWFAPHFEFRFPVAGELAARAIHLTLRQALEPWHVLGEEGAGRRHGALRRLVGRAPAGAGHRAHRRSLRRHLQRPGAAAAADRTQRRVRRRRALSRLAAAVGLHPTIPVHAPLTFDVVDTWMERIRRRLPVSRDASGRTQLRSVPGQQLRGREPPAGAFHARSRTRPDGSRWRRRREAGSFRTRSICARLQPVVIASMVPARPHPMSDERPAPVQTRPAVMERLASTYRVADGHFDELLAGPETLRDTGVRFRSTPAS